jgi:hypothetical protein
MAQSGPELAWATHQGSENRRQKVPTTHGDFLRGDGHMQEPRGKVCAVALEDGSTQRRPCQGLSDSALLSVKGMQIGIRFPLCE